MNSLSVLLTFLLYIYRVCNLSKFLVIISDKFGRLILPPLMAYVLLTELDTFSQNVIKYLLQTLSLIQGHFVADQVPSMLHVNFRFCIRC